MATQVSPVGTVPVTRNRYSTQASERAPLSFYSPAFASAEKTLPALTPASQSVVKDDPPFVKVFKDRSSDEDLFQNPLIDAFRPDDLKLSPLQQWCLRSIARYQKHCRYVDENGEIKNRLGAKVICEFTPSCSTYTAEAIRTLGVFRGIFKGGLRVLRCNKIYVAPFRKKHHLSQGELIPDPVSKNSSTATVSNCSCAEPKQSETASIERTTPQSRDVPVSSMNPIPTVNPFYGVIGQMNQPFLFQPLQYAVGL